MEQHQELSPRTYWRVPGMGAYQKGPVSDPELVDGSAFAEMVVASLTTNEMHRPVIDLDVPASLVASSTPGHSHLFIDHEIGWEEYVGLLVALTSTGIIEPGYYGASIRRGFTAVRIPGIGKEPSQ